MNTLAITTFAYSIIKPKIVACSATSALHDAFTLLPVRARQEPPKEALYPVRLERQAQHSRARWALHRLVQQARHPEQPIPVQERLARFA